MPEKKRKEGIFLGQPSELQRTGEEKKRRGRGTAILASVKCDFGITMAKRRGKKGGGEKRARGKPLTSAARGREKEKRDGWRLSSSA